MQTFSPQQEENQRGWKGFYNVGKVMQSDVSDLLWTQGHSQICNNMSVHSFLAKVPCQSDKVTYNITVNTLIWSHSQMSPFSILHSQIDPVYSYADFELLAGSS